MDQWSELKQYELQQRQRRIAKSQQIAEEQERKKKEAEQQQLLREQARIMAEQRQAEERRSAKQQEEKTQRQVEEAQKRLLTQSAEDLRRANLQREEAQHIASQQLQAAQQVREKGSPIEWAFFEEWCLVYPDIVLARQHPIGKYRVDFAHIASMTVIELDGHEYHHTRRDRTKDYQRQRYIEDLGWHFLRFTGSEIFSDVASCVEIVGKRIQAR